MATTTVNVIEIESSRGKKVKTYLSDEEAIAIVRDNRQDSSFGRDLIAKRSRYGLTPDQIVWIHVLAMEYVSANDPDCPAELKNGGATRETVEVGDLKGLVDLLSVAGRKLKYPKVRLRVGAFNVVLKSKAGRIDILDADRKDWSDRFNDHLPRYYGKVVDGKFDASSKAIDGLVEMLREMSVDPVKTAREYGRLTGNCCFCGLKLTDPQSTAAGFGETCAKNFGLHEQYKAAVNVIRDDVAPEVEEGANAIDRLASGEFDF